MLNLQFPKSGKKSTGSLNFRQVIIRPYGGQFQNLLTAKKRLGIAVPAALFLIFMILFFTFHSVKQTLLIFSAVPFAAIGGNNGPVFP